MTDAVYPKWKEALLTGAPNSTLTGSGPTGLYAVLIDKTVYTYNAAHQFYTSITGIVAPEKEITGVTLVNGVVDGNDVVYPSVLPGNSIGAIVLFRKNADGIAAWRLVCYLDSTFGAPAIPNGGDITLTWSSTGIFSL